MWISYLNQIEMLIDFMTGNTFSDLILYMHLTPAINQYKHNLEMTVS